MINHFNVLCCDVYEIIFYRYIFLPLQGFIVITLLISNLYLVVRENKLRHSEIPQRIVNILLKLKGKVSNRLSPLQYHNNLNIF